MGFFHWKNTLNVCSIGFALLTLSSLSWADRVLLKGQKSPIDGHILSIQSDRLIIRTNQGQELPLSRSAIDSIEFQSDGSPKAKEGQSMFSLLKPSEKPALSPKLIQQSFLTFPNEQGIIDEKQFTVLSKFKGKSSQRLYAGLYAIPNEATFWLRLAEPTHQSGELQFTLYGKRQNSQPSESYSVQARFLDETGKVIDDSATLTFNGTTATFVEWFPLLEEVTGLTGTQEVQWKVPLKTKTIELRVKDSQAEGKHLVGYLSNLTLVLSP